MATFQKKIKLAFLVLFFGMAWSLPASPVRDYTAAKSIDCIESSAQLPFDAEVEYIESTGEQFIITPVCISDDMDVKVCAAATGPSTDGNIIAGARDKKLGISNYIILASGTLRLITSDRHLEMPFDNEFHIYTCSQTELSIDGLTSARSGNDAISNLNYVLFAYNYLGKITLKCRCRISYVDFGDRVRMKAVRFTNEFGQQEGAMYDFVSGELFRNSGTGSFIIGPDL